MKTILGIEIPANLAELDSDALKALATSLRTAALTAAKGDVTPEVLAEIKEARSFATQASDAVAERTAADEALEADRKAELEALEAELADEDDPEVDPEVDEDPELSDEEKAQAEADAAAKADEDAKAASTYKPKAKALADDKDVKDKVEVPPAPEPLGTYAEAGFVSTSNSNGVDAGDPFENLSQLSAALVDRAKAIEGGAAGKEAVGRIDGRFSEAQILTLDAARNVELLGGSDPLSRKAQRAVTAAMCAPEEPTYALATTSSTARPVKASLAVYRPARGSVSVYPTPKLGDIDDEVGRGIWTKADDGNDAAVKNACATIPCATSVVYDIYGIYRCLTVTSMLSMTFPELVEAYLNRLGALTARLGDSTLLDAMVGSVNTKTLTVASNGFGASINLLTTILNAVAVYREEERYGDQQFDAWAPRWIIPALQIDLVNQRRTSGPLRDRLPSQAEIEAVLREAGIDITWTLDYAEGWETVPPAVDGEDLPALPTSFDIIVSPKGNFRALDRGDLTVGVANGNIYRDNASNTKNRFTIFQESFEGLMDLGATNYVLHLNDVCFGGTQTMDVEAICPAGS